MTNAFTLLNLHPQLAEAVGELGYTELTPVQEAVIPAMLDGQDVIAQAQTGSGKTAAFSLPILQSMVPGQGHLQSLILVPTRELALQVAQAITAYGRYRNVRVLAVYGGQAYSRQMQHLKNGVDIVVGTPGRLLDLMQRQVLHLDAIHTVVLDEADEMLSMGFIDDIETILKAMPTSRQTALFSATMPSPIRRLAERYMRTPRSVTIQHKQLTVATIEQRYYLVNAADKLAALTRIFEVETITSALIFVRTRVSAGELANALTVRGFPAEALHGDLSQEAREHVLGRFRRHQLTVLVGTDVAARGLDIEDISHVFNYDLPHEPELYVHRIGRTGRAGKTGIAVTLLTPQERYRLRQIEAYTRQEMTRKALPSVEEIQAYREAQMLEQVMVWLRRGRSRRERELVASLIEQGHDPLDIAAAALKTARAEEKQRPIEAVSEVQESRMAPRKAAARPVATQRRHSPERPGGSREKGMVQLTLNAGKAHGMRPGDVVGMIAYHADIPGHSIGAIRIQENHTLVDVPEQFVARVLAKAGAYRIRKQVLQVKRAVEESYLAASRE